MPGFVQLEGWILEYKTAVDGSENRFECCCRQ
jgi:hypothetical protein